jgi:hypothetical protein
LVEIVYSRVIVDILTDFGLDVEVMLYRPGWRVYVSLAYGRVFLDLSLESLLMMLFRDWFKFYPKKLAEFINEFFINSLNSPKALFIDMRKLGDWL